MTALCRWTRVSAIALVVVAYSPAAFAQETAAADAHKEHHSQAAKPSGGNQAATPMGREMMARMMEQDVLIEMLTADMNVLVGDQKIAAMATLLTALVERNRVMRDTMMQMHEQMMQKMMGEKGKAPAAEAGMTCCSKMKAETASPRP